MLVQEGSFQSLCRRVGVSFRVKCRVCRRFGLSRDVPDHAEHAIRVQEEAIVAVVDKLELFHRRTAARLEFRRLFRDGAVTIDRSLVDGSVVGGVVRCGCCVLAVRGWDLDRGREEGAERDGVRQFESLEGEDLRGVVVALRARVSQLKPIQVSVSKRSPRRRHSRIRQRFPSLPSLCATGWAASARRATVHRP